jgi:cytochrome c oxidase assembly factor CtaG
MKKFLKEFLLRGLVCAGGGPIVLAIIYGILGATGAVEFFSPREVCTEILTITLLAFLAAGMTAVYQMEQLPLLLAILLHGGVLYIGYILTYLLNGWLQSALMPILVFTGIFLAGYAFIWLIIYRIQKAKTEKLNKLLKQQ